MKKHIYDENNRLHYTLADDGMYYPDLELQKEDNTWVGKYGLMRERFLQERKHNLYMSLYLSETLTNHLIEINEQAQNQVDEIVTAMAKAEGCNEELKAADQMKWVGLMNNYKACAEDMVLRALVYI